MFADILVFPIRVGKYETLRRDRYNRLNWLDFTSPDPLEVPGPLFGGL
jgi:hypothetical protein